MNKQMKQHLETVVNSIVNEDTDAASAAFHEYLRMKTQTILLGESDDDCEDDKKSDDKDEDDKKSDDKDEDDKKSDDKEEDRDDAEFK